MNSESPAPSNGFIIYHPKIRITKRAIFQNEEASKILSQCSCSAGTLSLPDIYSLCSKWENCLKKALPKASELKETHKNYPNVLELIHSGRRIYAVKGVLLMSDHSQKEREKSYLFSFERISKDKINLPLFARKWKLSKREQEVVGLLLKGLSNKEIAHVLNLSPNTIKGYLRIVMTKLGVSKRTGIISLCILQSLEP